MRIHLLRHLLLLLNKRECCDHVVTCNPWDDLGQQTAFLVPCMVVENCHKPFCRSAAVYGATYLLRRGLDGIVLSTTDNSGSGNGNDNVVTGVRLLPSDETSTNEETTSTTTTPSKLPKQVLCKHVIVPEQVLAQPPFAPILPKNLC
mmetsp:Transcript_5212/g.6809  ORF Transcript_5212/g.6809 Transcript_5212/m.6809 type:complete len:147 (-) Transcript_5212:59-499(-)